MTVNLMQEETLSSFAIRSLYVSGTIDIEKICSRLFLNRRGEWKIFPSANLELSKIFSNVIEQNGVDNIIANHTLAPLYQPISEINLNAFQKSRLTTVFNKDPGTSMPLCFVSAEILSSYILYCPTCFSEQVKEFGFTWFKREWQIHRMASCLEHGCRLLSKCSCGKKGKNVSWIVSMLQGYCEYCNSPHSSSHVSDIDSAYPAWLRHVLNEKLPIFSPELRAYLIKKSASIIGIKQRASAIEICKFLTRLYDPYLMERPKRPLKIGKRDRFTELNYTHRLLRAINSISWYPDRIRPYDPIIPHTCLFHPLSCAFPIFSEFLAYLNEISYRTNKETNFGAAEEILELKSGWERRNL